MVFVAMASTRNAARSFGDSELAPEGAHRRASLLPAWATPATNRAKSAQPQAKGASCSECDVPVAELVPLSDGGPKRTLPSFGDCAVVSSSALLLKSRYGEEIDAHDAVFRCNDHPTAGYERHVGNRTTVRLVNSQHNGRHLSHFREFSSTDEVVMLRDWRPFEPSLESWNRNTKYKVLDTYKRAHAMAPSWPIFIISRRLQRYAMGCLGSENGPSPTTGLVALLQAQQMCEKVTVYGVGCYSCGYYTGSRFGASWHNLKDEKAAILRIANANGTGTSIASLPSMEDIKAKGKFTVRGCGRPAGGEG